MAKAGRGADQFPLRLPNGMRDQLKQSAEANGRSMNAEIVARLEATLEGKPFEGATVMREPMTPELFDKLFGESRFLDEVERLRGELKKVTDAIGRADNLLGKNPKD